MYNYYDEVRNDINTVVLEYHEYDAIIEDCEDVEELESRLYDELWIDDAITGNASGSYYCNSYQAEEALAGNWDLLADALNEFCCDADGIRQGAEWGDVTIRCYVLGAALHEFIEDNEEELKEMIDAANIPLF